MAPSSASRSRARAACAAGCLAALAAACQPLEQLSREWDALVAVVSGQSSPLGRKPGKGGASPGPGAEVARRVRANRELLTEMVRVVFLREPTDQAQFASLVDSMNQGASLEGIHNGFVHSSAYRALEREHPGASPAALRVFAEEVAELQSELAAEAELPAQAARPLALPVQPRVQEAVPAPAAAPAPGQPRRTREQLRALYAERFAGASIFTLKRVLVDEAQRLLEEKRQTPGAVNLWYGPWAARLAARKVDFGLAQRNRPDERFHLEWAKAASEDQLHWEVLNRLHRALNHYQRET